MGTIIHILHVQSRASAPCNTCKSALDTLDQLAHGRLNTRYACAYMWANPQWIVPSSANNRAGDFCFHLLNRTSVPAGNAPAPDSRIGKNGHSNTAGGLVRHTNRPAQRKAMLFLHTTAFDVVSHAAIKATGFRLVKVSLEAFQTLTTHPKKGVNQVRQQTPWPGFVVSTSDLNRKGFEPSPRDRRP